MSYAVSMTDKDVATIHVIDGTMARSLILLLIALNEKHASTLEHIAPIGVKVGPLDVTAAPYSHAIVALCATTTVVPRYKEIVIVVMSHDEGCLYGIDTGIL